MLQVVLDVSVFDGRLFAVEHVDPGGHNVERHHLVVLCQEDGVRQANVAGASDGDFQLRASVGLGGGNPPLFKGILK